MIIIRVGSTLVQNCNVIFSNSSDEIDWFEPVLYRGVAYRDVYDEFGNNLPVENPVACGK